MLWKERFFICCFCFFIELVVVLVVLVVCILALGSFLFLSSISENEKQKSMKPFNTFRSQSPKTQTSQEANNKLQTRSTQNHQKPCFWHLKTRFVGENLCFSIGLAGAPGTQNPRKAWSYRNLMNQGDAIPKRTVAHLWACQASTQAKGIWSKAVWNLGFAQAPQNKQNSKHTSPYKANKTTNHLQQMPTTRKHKDHPAKPP